MALAATVAVGTAASAADKLTLQLKWVTQAQFAGYYVAADRGFYSEEGQCHHQARGPDVSPVQVIAGGGADVVIDWMPSALIREKGVNLVNIAQPFKSSNDAYAPWDPVSNRRRTSAARRSASGSMAMNIRSRLDEPARHSDRRQQQRRDVLKQGFNVDPILQKQARRLHHDLQRVLAGDRRRSRC